MAACRFYRDPLQKVDFILYTLFILYGRGGGGILPYINHKLFEASHFLSNY